jgi:DNA replication and repair protein RecF
MYITHLSATLFRNYTRLELELPARINVLQGANAQGKTNLLEMVYYLATCKSPLAGSDRQLMHWDAEREVIPHSDVQVVYVRDAAEHTLDVTLMLEMQPGEPLASAVLRKQFRLDGVPRRAMDIVGRLNAVLFLPQDIDLVSGSPSARRRYLDISLCQIDSLYCQTLTRYNRIISQRNALLRQIRERASRPDELGYWDAQLGELGAYLLWRRLWAVGLLQPEADGVQRAVTDDQERLTLVYQDTLTGYGAQNALEGVLPVDPARQEPQLTQLRALFGAALAAARREERARGVTLVGPHRDDLRFLINGVDATIYGSRGQQRSVALALKLAEMQLMRHQTGEMPVLLLDDVVSELDQQRCRLLLRAVSEAQQVLITTTDLKAYGLSFLQGAALWHVEAGAITPLPSV